MTEVHTGRINKVEIGTTAGTNTDMVNVILMNWERNHDVRPRLFANSKVPTEYQQSHSWIIGTFSVLSDHPTAIYATAVNGAGDFAMDEDGDSAVMDFFQITYDTSNTTRFFDAIIYRYTKEILNYDDSVYVYHFLAGYAEDS